MEKDYSYIVHSSNSTTASPTFSLYYYSEHILYYSTFKLSEFRLLYGTMMIVSIYSLVHSLCADQGVV